MRLLIAVLLGFATYAQPPAVFAEWKKDSALRGALISACVMDASGGKILHELNKDLSVVPASTMKLFTTGAALALLGPDFIFTTTIGHTGTFDRSTGTLSGDLVIVGGGDPSLQSEYFPTDLVRLWTEKLVSMGIKNINGDIVGWSGAFPRTIPDHWIWADISNYFGAVPSGLSYRDNKFSIAFSSGAAGSVATVYKIHPQYQTREITLASSVTCQGTSDQAYVYGDPFSFERSVRGTIPPQRGTFSIEAALPDPALLCAEDLHGSLTKAGIRCGGKATSSYSQIPPVIIPLYTHRSPSLATLVRHTNLHSDNMYCETIFLALGGGNRDSAAAAVKNYWKRAGMDSELIFLADGCGLARAGACSARLQCEALLHVYNDPKLFPAIDSSLPRAGREGSMRSIGKGTFIENNLRAKTGYMERVRAYAGYVKTRSGRDLVFSVIFNNYACAPAAARKKMERLMTSLGNL